MNNPWPRNHFLKVLAAIWISPWALLGLISGFCMFFFEVICYWIGTKDSQWTIGDGAVHIICNGKFGTHMYNKGWAAFTFGITVFYWTTNCYTEHTINHELVHINQGLKYGILYPFIYLYYLLKHGYQWNPFEVEARRKSNV